MKRRDRAIIAVILAAALIGGLVLVRRALDQAAQAQADSLAAAQHNSGEEAAPPGQGNAISPGEGPSSSGEDPDAQGGGEAQEPAPPEGAGQAGESSGGAVQTGAVTETGDPPAAGGGAVTLAWLSQWITGESSAALSADSLLQAEQAMAAGVGTADDALRRTFAQTQAQANDEARRNQLEEAAASLGLACLRCRDLVDLREEGVAFYQALTAAVSALTGTEGTEQAEADLQTAEKGLAAAELALAEARADLQAARDELNAALGNPYGTAIEVTDLLAQAELPSLTGDAAAELALAARNEVKEAAYAAERAQQTLTQLRYSCAPNSPEVLAQQAALQEAQAACGEANSQVEADVRDRLTRLGIQDRELEALSAELEALGTAPPEADYTLTGGEGEAWTSNLAQLTGQWAEIESIRASLITGIAQFNLDVLCFQHAIGAGCTAASI